MNAGSNIYFVFVFIHSFWCLQCQCSLCADSFELSLPLVFRNLKIPFAKWSSEQVCDWLEEIGLSQYSILARHWVSGGQTLLSATPHDLERVNAHARTHTQARTVYRALLL